MPPTTQHVARPYGSSINRRLFLRLAAAGATLPVLQACNIAPPSGLGNARPTSATTASTAVPTGARLPTYQALTGLNPDLPPTDAGLQAGYFAYPKNQIKSVTEAPGLGSDVTAVAMTGTVPPAVDQNAAWQAANQQMNANLKLRLLPSDAYSQQVSVIIAGNDLPDLFNFNHGVVVPSLPQFVKSTYSDLTPYLAGDASKDYPNLAALSTQAWKQTLIDEAIYGVPVVRPAMQNVPFVNQSLFDSIGASQPTNADDFKRLLKELTRPEINQYAISAVAPGYGLTYDGQGEVPQLAMFGAPDNWAVDSSGRFTRDIETEQFKAALGFVHDMYAAGYYYPDPTLTLTTMRTQFMAGRIGIMMANGWAAYNGLLWDAGATLSPPIRVRTLRPFSMTGAQPIWHQSRGFNGFTAIKKSSPERTKELLRILNFLAAPFGSQEYLVLNYGVQGVDFNLDDKSNPAFTPRGKSEMAISTGWQYLATPLQVLFDPNDPEFVKAAYADAQAMVAAMIQDPSIGLFSATDLAKGGQLLQKFFDGIGDIVTGRADFNSLDQLLKDWRSGGGDQIRMEYQQAYASAS